MFFNVSKVIVSDYVAVSLNNWLQTVDSYCYVIAHNKFAYKCTLI